MKLLLIVGHANDIFIYNYAKWLSSCMEVTIDVFELFDNSGANQQGYDYEYFNLVETAKGYQLPFPFGKGMFDPFARGRCLRKFLRGRYYDIIHCHWILAPVVLQRNIKNHCCKFVLSFWGGELRKQTVLGSNRLYRYHLNELTKEVDAIINGVNGKDKLLKKLPFFKGAYYRGYLGSSPLETLLELMKIESRADSKQLMGIPIEKTTVLIGYSAKKIHQHLDIINAFRNNPILRNKVHLLAPMTRGASESYVKKVEEELIRSEYSFSLFKGTFLTDVEVARMRNATDIALQFSTFDGFSRSIIECLCAKSILIYGAWLNYSIVLKPNGFEGIEVNNISEGIQMVQDITSDITHAVVNTSNNQESGKRLALWSECIKDWVKAYEALLY